MEIFESTPVITRDEWLSLVTQPCSRFQIGQIRENAETIPKFVFQNQTTGSLEIATSA